LRKVLDKYLAKPALDWLVALGACAVVLYIESRHKHGLVFAQLPVGTRSSLYVTMAGIAGALLGFFIATVSILLGMLDANRPRLQRALAGNRAVLMQPVFFSAIRFTALALVSSLVLLVLDTKELGSRWAETMLVLVVLIGSVRTGRVIWFIRMLLAVASKEPGNSLSDPRSASSKGHQKG
jgi:hypothetical protein